MSHRHLSIPNPPDAAVDRPERPGPSPWQQVFLISSAALLVLLALAKWLALWHTRAGPLSDPPDPVFPFLSGRTLEMCAACLELTCGILVFCGRRRSWGPLPLLWWVVALLLYRLARFGLGGSWGTPCGCLGAASDWIGLDPTASSYLTWAILFYWCVGLGAVYLPKLPRLRPSALLPAILFPLAAWSAAPGHLFVEGTLVTTLYFENGLEQRSGTSHFEVRVAGDTWWIRNGHEYAFGLGSNNFDLLESWTTPGTAASAYRGYYPPFSTMAVVYPWVAYCSDVYFRNDPRGVEHLPIPWYVAHAEAQAHLCKAQVTFLDETFGLPERIRWITTHESLKNAGRSPFLRPPVNQSDYVDYHTDYTTLYPTGMVIMEYTVLATTNLAGRRLPLRSEFVFYLQRGLYWDLTGEPLTNSLRRPVRRSPHLTNTFPRARSVLQLTNWALIPGDIPLADLLPTPAAVTDTRLTAPRWRVDAVQYWVSNRTEWKFHPDQQLTNLLRAEIRRNQAAMLVRYGLRMVFYVFFGVLLAAPLFWVWRRIHRARPVQPQPPQPPKP